jgi:thiol:disulfide interchange protein DsbC
MLRNRLIALLGAISLSACAAEPGAGTARAATPAAKDAATAAAAPAPGDAAIRAAVAKAVPNLPVEAIRASPVAGFREVVIGGRVLYASQDGKYLLQGSLIRLADRKDMTDASEAVLRRDILDDVGPERRIVFPARGEAKHRITVFTDIDCGYCRKLHSQIADYNAAGITVDYLFFPRAGIDSESYDKAVSVWCAPDRRKALTDAKADRPVPKRTCANPIAAEYKLGQKVGVDGTPAVYLDDGSHLSGYLPPDEMLARLDEHAARQSEGAPKLAGN